jgi:hypothetical protein
MRRFNLAAALVLASLSLGGCASIDIIKQTWDAAKTVVVSKTGVVLAVSAFHAAERTATIYIKQKHCPVGVQKPTCMSPPIREQLAIAMTEGQKARDGLLDFAAGHPGAIGDQGLYDALKVSTATLKSIFQAYKIGPQ